MKITTLLMTLILASLAYADPLYVYERQPNKPSAVHHGLANGQPCLIQIYGEDSITEARAFGKFQADIKVPFKYAAQAIRDKAQELYKGKEEMIRWFEMDAAKSYDQAKASMK